MEISIAMVDQTKIVYTVSRDGWPSGMDNIFLAGSGYEPKMSAG